MSMKEPTEQEWVAIMRIIVILAVTSGIIVLTAQ